jgi:hypothetical protein
MEEKKVTMKFGLVQQGHIKTIETILDDWGSNEHSWKLIGKEIGWDAPTACYHYVKYLRKKLNP